MCCFSGVVSEISSTRIFAGEMANGEQSIIYSLRAMVGKDMAMVLPLPVAPDAGEDAVRFVDLSSYPEFFLDLEKAFEPEPKAAMVTAPAQELTGDLALPVHKVGSFDASFVPTVGDFERLDKRFQLPKGVFEALPQYRDYGFAVFKLQGKSGPFGLFTKPQRFHPMAFVFPRVDDNHVFFPTVHVHDQKVHAKASFDHTLFAQCRSDKIYGWRNNVRPLGKSVDRARIGDLVHPEQRCHRRAIHGMQNNADIWIDLASGRVVD